LQPLLGDQNPLEDELADLRARPGVPWMLVRGISDTPWYPNANAAGL
jgi:hypothetical protein